MSKSKKLKIAVTGNIGSGKSTFCKFIADAGYPVIEADEISKEILQKNKSIKNKVVKEFGKESYEGNVLNKSYLAEKVFINPKNVLMINSIVHPEVIKEVNKKTEQLLNDTDIVFVEAALIYEADMEHLFDFVILVSSDKTIRKDRVIGQNLTSEQFEQREINQIKDEEKAKRADFVFQNNEGIDELKQKAYLLLKILKKE
jgi:dephospho-CoA kinase